MKTENQTLAAAMAGAIRWNTQRTYTEHGQRIAALAIDGGVLMADVDRGLEYFFPGCPLERNAIMAWYDSDRPRENYCPSLPMDLQVPMRSFLERYARKATGGAK